MPSDFAGGHHDDDPDLERRCVVVWLECGVCRPAHLRDPARASRFQLGSPSSSPGVKPMLETIVKRKRRCRIPRRPHPELEFFFRRFERSRPEMLKPEDDPTLDDLDLDIPVRSSVPNKPRQLAH